MLIEKIRNFNKALNSFTEYLRENNNNISAFFTKLPIKFQFTIINHFLSSEMIHWINLAHRWSSGFQKKK